MRTVLLGEPPPEIESWLARRRALGQDRFDERWEGEYHVVPAPGGRHAVVDHQLARILGPLADSAGLAGAGPLNLGTADDFRVPDQAYLRPGPVSVFNPTAALVVEIISPGDESRHKGDFYHRHGVEELLLVDPDGRTVEWFTRDGGGFVPSDASALLGVTAASVAAALAWPA